MDYVWVCRSGSNEELRYSIRSVVKHQPDANIIVVGDKPRWYDGVFYPSNRIHTHKLFVVRKHLQRIVNNDNIADSFVLMNDDFVFLKPFKHIPTYTVGTLKNHIGRYETESTYVKWLKQTHDTLVEAGVKKPLSFEAHTPMMFKKDKLGEILKMRGLWRSLYGNMADIMGTFLSEDVKIYSNPDSQVFETSWEHCMKTGFLSTEDRSFMKLREQLNEMFPEPTIYEKEGK